MTRRSRGPRREPAPSARSSGAWTKLFENDAILVLVCVWVALWVQRRALGVFFALDDLVLIEAVRGLRPPDLGPWRLLSRHLFFGAAVPAFGENPVPYHLVSWLLHGANVALIYVFTRRWGAGRIAAIAAAALFGATRLHAPALESAARVGEPLALALTLAALLASERGRRASVVGGAIFALAMLAKESVALLPAVLLLPRPGGPAFSARLRQATPLIGAGGVVTVVLILSGTGAAHLGGEAYARGFGSNLFFNLMTYARWAADLTSVLPGQVSAIAHRVWPIGLAVTLALAAVAAVTRGGTALAPLGALWWLLALAPVLPLLHHTYLYSLYVPLAGVAIAVAGAVEWVARRSWSRKARPSVAANGFATVVLAILVAHAAFADRLLAARLRTFMPGTGIPLDPDLRKSEMARQAIGAVAQYFAGRRGRVAFFIPEALREVHDTASGQVLATPAQEASSHPMLEDALNEGAGLRALVPNVDSVAFLRAWQPGYGDFELFAQSPDGRVFPLGRGPDGFATAGGAIVKGGAPAIARDLLAEAVGEFPDHSRLRFQYAHALQLTGDSLRGRRELEELIRRAPADPLAKQVRSELERQHRP